MKIGNSLLLVYAIVPILLCSTAQKAGAVSQDFNLFTDGTAVNSVPGWQAPADYVIRQNTQIDKFSTNVGSLGYPGVIYGSAGYNNSQGVESDFSSLSGTQVRGALWTLTGGDVVNQNGAVFQAQVRLSSYGVGGTGNTNTVADAGNGFEILLGSGLSYNTAASRYDYVNALAFGLYFYDNGSGSLRVYTDRVGFDDASHGTPGFSTASGSLANWNSYVAGWQRDAWYTLQLSGISFSSNSPTNATASLSVFKSDNPTVMLYSNVLVRAQAGSAGVINTAFTSINQIAFADARVNGVDTLDNISLMVPEPNSTLLCLVGLFGMAMMVGRRYRKER
jgi:hypothetical protein